MKCKVLKYRHCDYRDVLQQMESDINSWLNVGWKLHQVIYDNNLGGYTVFLIYGE